MITLLNTYLIAQSFATESRLLKKHGYRFCTTIYANIIDGNVELRIESQDNSKTGSKTFTLTIDEMMVYANNKRKPFWRIVKKMIEAEGGELEFVKGLHFNALVCEGIDDFEKSAETFYEDTDSASKEAPVASLEVEVEEVIVETPESQELETPTIEPIITETETMRELTTAEWNKAEAAIFELAKTDLVARSLYNSYSDGDAGTTEYDIFAYVESKKNSISPIDAYHAIKDLCEDRFVYCELKGNRVVIDSTSDEILIPSREIANRAGLTVSTNSMVSSATNRNKTASSFGDLF